MCFCDVLRDGLFCVTDVSFCLTLQKVGSKANVIDFEDICNVLLHSLIWFIRKTVFIWHPHVQNLIA